MQLLTHNLEVMDRQLCAHIMYVHVQRGHEVPRHRLRVCTGFPTQPLASPAA
jgi:hypothetical protein